MESGNGDAKLLSDASMTVKASLGETAVDFTFASPVLTPFDDLSTGSQAVHLFPIFVLHGNGNVFCLLTG
jgi:hypothetical protein